MLFKRSDDAKRKQSIYSQISLNCYASGDSNTGPKHSKIIDFSLGFREAFSLLPFCLWGFIWSNTVELGGSEKKFVIPMRVNTLMRVSVILWAIYAMRRGCAFRYTPIATMYGQSHSRQSPLIFYWARQCSCRANCQENGARYLNILPHFVIYRFILPSGKRIRLGSFNYCNSTVARRL